MLLQVVKVMERLIFENVSLLFVSVSTYQEICAEQDFLSGIAPNMLLDCSLKRYVALDFKHENNVQQ